MPFAAGPRRLPRRLPRRQVLLVATLSLVTGGCGLRVGQPTTQQTPTTSIDDAARTRAAAAADDLATAAQSLARSSAPQTLAALRMILSDHLAHAQALRGRSARPAPLASAITPIGPAGDQTPAALAQAERAAAADLDADLLIVGSATARLLAAVRASRILHAAQLERTGG